VHNRPLLSTGELSTKIGYNQYTMSAPLTLAELLPRLDARELLILPTPRAAARLYDAFDHHQRSSGRAVWEPAMALAWTQFLRGLWSELVLNGAEPRLLLNPAQEHALWREIVAESFTAALGSADALAELAQSAWQLAAQHNALARLRATGNTHDSRIFADWANTFNRRCEQHGYLSPALLESALQQHLSNHSLAGPTNLTLIGFLEKTPAQQSLLAALDDAGTAISEHTLLSANSDSTHAWTTTPSERDEFTFAARWTRTLLEANPSASIAILVPDLADARAGLEDALRETLAPELQSIRSDLAAAPWEFPTGPALAALPLIADALRLAHWAAHPLDAVTALLLSPYLAQTALEPDRNAAARFDATNLRRAPMLRDEIKLPWLLSVASRNLANRNLANHDAEPSGEPQPAILTALRDFQSLLNRTDLLRPRSYADWTEVLRDNLRSVGWPGARELNATEFAATRAWDGLLDNLATLDFAGRRVSYTAVLAELDRQARATPFTAPATHAPVQVMSPADSAGCSFDAVLFLRATDANWPAPERTHPLLSWPLQRSLAMPGADPARTAARARAFTGDLLQRCGQTLFTHAAEDADGHLRPSTLLAALHLQQVDIAEFSGWSTQPPAPGRVSGEPQMLTEIQGCGELQQPIALESFPDNSPLPPLPTANVPGGARVLTLQAACGFRAFAELRLRATAPDAPTLGLDAGESGSVLHRALQTFWSRLRTQKALRDLSPDDRTRILAESIDTAIPRRIRPDGAWDNAYLALQKDRLLAVLTPWLEHELQRGPFEVLAIEAEQEVSVGPLTFEVRLDRIDRILSADEEATAFFLVDYKSGLSGHPRDWETERPNDPQLPLYALLHEPAELKGLAFAKVRAGKEMRWLGLQSEDGLLPASRANHLVELEYLLQDWRTHLTRLAEEFASGDTRVAPRDFHKDCPRCTQRLLCRVDFATLTDTPSEEEEEETANG
jgi:ATP-dependent helicase/nuclease subunit B